MTETPASLLDRLKKPGNEQAWSRFVELYTPLLFAWARRVGLQSQDAADLVQDVLTLLVKKLPEFTYNPNRRFRAWLRTVLVNKWRENHRRRDAMANGQAEALPELEEPDGVAAFWEDEYRRHLASRALRLLKIQFQPQTWQAFWEFVVNDRPAAEVAEEMGVTASAVYVAKTRVLGHLRRELDGLLD